MKQKRDQETNLDKINNIAILIGGYIKEWLTNSLGGHLFGVIAGLALGFGIMALIFILCVALWVSFDIHFDAERFNSLYDECIVREFSVEICFDFSVENSDIEK